jgi:hypothetical protein
VDDGRIGVSTDRVGSYTCAERERERVCVCSCLTSVYSHAVLYNIHTKSKPDVSGLRHYNRH